LRSLRKRLPTELIRRDGLDQRTPVKPAIHIEQRAAFGDEVWVPEVKRTVEVPEVCIAEIFEDR